MEISAETLKLLCPSALVHLRLLSDWSRPPSESTLFCRNLLASIPAADLLDALDPESNYLVTMFVTPILLTLGSHILNWTNANKNGLPHIMIHVLQNNWERSAQVISLISGLACAYFGAAPLTGWLGIVLALQTLNLGRALWFDYKRWLVTKATSYVRANLDNYRDPQHALALNPQAKSYYHLLTIANDDVKDPAGSEFRKNLLKVIDEAEDQRNPERAAKALELSNLAFKIECLSLSRAKSVALEDYVTRQANRQQAAV